VLIMIVWLLAQSPIAAAGPAIRIVQGAGSFQFVDNQGDVARKITVFTYLPSRIKAKEAPIVFVLHGYHRTAKGYRDDWARQAEKYGFMVLAPLFDAQTWSNAEYAYASVVGADGTLRDPSNWSYTVIERLFDAVKAATGNEAPRYFLYGFSEGGQFVHRLVLLLPEARYAKAIAGDPGWYTMPRFDIKFPYGLRGSPVNGAGLRTSLGRDFVLMLGDADNDPNDPEVRETRQALAQGANRLQRGQAFFAEAKASASEMQVAFGWQVRFVGGVAHEPRKMSGPAAAVLMQR
jgi:poly(3-hydroxybutyrate) depolymerase